MFILKGPYKIDAEDIVIFFLEKNSLLGGGGGGGGGYNKRKILQNVVTGSLTG